VLNYEAPTQTLDATPMLARCTIIIEYELTQCTRMCQCRTPNIHLIGHGVSMLQRG